MNLRCKIAGAHGFVFALFVFSSVAFTQLDDDVTLEGLRSKINSLELENRSQLDSFVQTVETFCATPSTLDEECTEVKIVLADKISEIAYLVFQGGESGEAVELLQKHRSIGNLSFDFYNFLGTISFDYAYKIEELKLPRASFLAFEDVCKQERIM